MKDRDLKVPDEKNMVRLPPSLEEPKAGSLQASRRSRRAIPIRRLNGRCFAPLSSVVTQTAGEQPEVGHSLGHFQPTRGPEACCSIA